MISPMMRRFCQMIASVMSTPYPDESDNPE